MKKILIYDDEATFADSLRKSLDKLPILTNVFDVDRLDETKFNKSMQALEARQSTFRKTGKWDDEPIPLDKASIFIVDYDLVKSKAGAFLTGETVAYLARCFSHCGLIVGLNQFLGTDFDLTLKGHLESFADLNINSNHLCNVNLWGDSKKGFRPWYWPILPEHLGRFEKKVKDIKNSLTGEDRPIYEVLGFPLISFEMLPRSIGQFIGAEPVATNFRQFVVESGNGLRGKDATSMRNAVSKIAEDVVARVGAARISKWLERLVLPGQDILVDAPHLISRYPSLLTGQTSGINSWNKTAQSTDYRKLGISVKLIEPFRLKQGHWLSRPGWFWHELQECQAIPEVAEPWKTHRPSWVFCEDASRFYQEKVCRAFVADTESPYSRRFVRQFMDIVYQPQVRFSL